ERARVKILLSPDHYLLLRAADLDHVERRAGGDAQSLALADGEVVNAPMLADHFAVGGHEVARGVGQTLAPLGEVGINEALVVAAGDEAYLLRVGLFGDGESVLVRQLADLRLGHVA